MIGGPGAGVCPCGSGAGYGAGRSDYVFRTWHPRTRPADVAASPELTWTGLTVLRTVDGGDTDESGLVEFEASFTTGEDPGLLRETSRFVRRRGTWVYVDGDVSQQS